MTKDSSAPKKNKASAVHGAFTMVRELPHAPERVFAAWSEPKAKAAWFSGPSGQWASLERIVYSDTMHVDEKKISVSLATIQFEPAEAGGKAGTKMTLTEQGAFLDGYDDAGSRERGIGSLMVALQKSLEK